MSTIPDLLQNSCQNHPSQIALREKRNKSWKTLSYADLWRDSDLVASGLQRLGKKKGDHAALLGSSSLRWVTTYLGILKAGLVAIPIDKELKQNELRHVLRDSDANILFTTQDYVEMALDIRTSTPDLAQIVILDSAAGPGLDIQIFNTIGDLIAEWHQLINELQIPRDKAARLEALANRTHRLLTQPQASGEEGNLVSDLFSPAASLRKEALKKGILLDYEHLLGNNLPESVELTSQDTAVILYTSGTTGRSKGAILTHANITSNIKDLIPHFQLDQRIHTLSFLPINHVFEQVCGILLPLALGGTVSFAESLKKLGENLSEVRPTFLLGVPAVYRIFLDR
ncbi:MAG: AMP-binding protein, partial [Desulfuromonas sp.]